MTVDHHPVTSRGKSVPGTDPRIRHRIQIVMFRTIRVDHTNCLQVDIKTHSFIHTPFLQTILTWENVCLCLEESPTCFPYPLTNRPPSWDPSFSCQKVSCPCGGDRCLMCLIPLHHIHHPVPHRLLYQMWSYPICLVYQISNSVQTSSDLPPCSHNTPRTTHSDTYLFQTGVTLH
jgi:hypothetical protein